ncbi:MAG: TonB family protein [Calditrichaeota bacterium]|nr:TonB family protein [Calditrichota bacterium]
MKHLFRDEKVLSVGITIIVHLLLLLLFIAIHVDFSPVVTEFVELSFAGGIEAPDYPPSVDEEAGDVPDTEPTAAEDAEMENVALQEIELPERRELAVDEEEIVERLQPEPEKRFEVPPVSRKIRSSPALPGRRQGAPSTFPFKKREKEVPAGIFKRRTDDLSLTGTQKVTQQLSKDFEIDWEGEIQREIYQKKLPEFPPDVQREATIKIKFTVLPNGLVGSAVLLQKGDTRLENLTLEAFKTWRFNPLPPYVEQVPQHGVITFRFKLK